MSTVVMHAVVSVDGFVADDDDQVGPLFDWYFNGDRSLFESTKDSVHPSMSISARSYGYVKPFWDSIRCAVVGRHLFDLTNGWEAKPPACERLSSCHTGRGQTAGTRRSTFPSWTTSPKRSRLHGSSPTAGW